MSAASATRMCAAVCAAVAAIAAMWASVATANVVSEYHPSDQARSFGSSAGGWEASQGSSGLCVGSLTCPAITSEFTSSGGAEGAGDGFLRSRIGSIAGVASESNAIWTSPVFTYAGIAGATPDELRLTLQQRAEVSAFLEGAGNSVDFSVLILRGAAGDEVAVRPVNREPVDDKSNWAPTPPVEVGVRSLDVGQRYRLRVVTRFTSGAVVVPGALADYDNVSLRAVDLTQQGGGSNGSNGQNGQDGQNAGSGLSVREVRSIIEKGLPRTATVAGNQVFVRLRCPGRVTGRCRYAIVGLERRGGARTTLPRFARVQRTKAKRLGLSVRPGSAARIAQQKKALFRIRVRALGRTTTYFKQLRLVQTR